VGLVELLNDQVGGALEDGNDVVTKVKALLEGMDVKDDQTNRPWSKKKTKLNH